MHVGTDLHSFYLSVTPNGIGFEPTPLAGISVSLKGSKKSHYLRVGFQFVLQGSKHALWRGNMLLYIIDAIGNGCFNTI